MKKQIRILVTAFLLFCTASLAAGCQAKDTAPQEKTAGGTVSPSATETAAPSPDNSQTYPRELQLSDNTTVKLTEKPSHIASLVFGTDEMLLGLTDMENIAGLSGKDSGAGYLSDPDKSSDGLPRINDNAEVLLSLTPDLVIGASWGDEDLLAQIKDSQIPYYGYVTPKTMEEQIQIIRDLGYLLGEDEKAETVAGDMEDRMQAVKDTVSAVPEEERVTVLPYNMHESTNGSGTIMDDMISQAGGVNLASQAGLESSAKISKEQIVDMDPQVLLLTAWATDTGQEFEAFAQQLKNDPSLQDVDAVKNGRIYTSADNSITNVSQYAIDGMEFVASSCYPELFSR